MATAPRPLVIGLVAGLGLAIVAVVVLSGDQQPATQSPSATAAASAGGSASSASPDPSPAPTAAGDPNELLAEIERQVVELRGLAAPEIGPPDIITRDQLAAELEELLDAEWTSEELRRSNVTLRAMGLLEDGQDLRELTEELLAGQVAGFYDPLDERMVVVSESGLDAEAQIYYAHEFTHALQDAAFDTFSERDELTDDDAVLARQALEEGDATAVMVQWALLHIPDEIADIAATPVPDMSGIPGWMVRQLLFPYEAGFSFVVALGGLQDWSAVDEAYADPPVSTEQVLHPEKYVAGEEPVEVLAPQLADRLGGGWEDLEPTTMGEAMIDIWLDHLGAGTSVSADAAAGWGGDRLTVASGPDDAWAMAWRITWDTAADADAFAEAHATTEGGPGAASRLERRGPQETIVLRASSAELLAQL